MKKILALALLIMNQTAFSANIVKTINVPVKKATVYLSGARLYQQDQVTVPAGTSEWIFTGISPYAQATSIESSGKGAFTILENKLEARVPQVNKQVIKKNQGLINSIRLTEDSLEQYRFDSDELKEKLNILAIEKNILMNHRIIKGETKKDSIELVKQSMEYLHMKLNAINSDLFKLKKNERVLNKQITSTQTRLNELYRMKDETQQGEDAPQGPEYVIIITVYADVATSGSLELSYFTASAGWTPFYELRGNKEGAQKLKIIQKAKVFQNSGIDWKDCQLTLSSSTPGIGNNKPQLYPQVLNYFVAYTRSIMKKDKARAEGLAMDIEMESYANAPTSASKTTTDEKKLEEANSLADYTIQSESLISVEYLIKINYTLLSEEQEKMVVIQEKELPAEYTYYAVPKLDKNAFLQAKVSNWEDMNLLPGESRVYFDGSLVAETYLNPGLGEDTLVLNLGRDRGIEITRTQVKDKNKKKNFSDKTIIENGYELSIRNPKNTELNIKIEDQIPVSKNKDILVTLKEQSAAQYEEASGKLTWNLKIKAKDTKKLKFLYEVSHPSDKPLAGI